MDFHTAQSFFKTGGEIGIRISKALFEKIVTAVANCGEGLG